MTAADRAVLDRWWQQFATTGTLPDDLQIVQSRLVRAVHRGVLPSGPVFVKTMTFPRAKDRLRYLLRALPGQHEADMLRAVKDAGYRCPEVVAVRTQRSFGLPQRSFLVLRALPVDERAGARVSMAESAVLVLGLLSAGIEHRDLHAGNFLPLADGEVAVLDLQSASRRRRPLRGRASRVTAAARLLRDHVGGNQDDAVPLIESGLLQSMAEFAMAWQRAQRELARFHRSRMWRCFGESTEFHRRIGWSGVEHRTRGELPPGSWLWPSPNARRQWLGQRALQVFAARPLVFPAFFRKWWWWGDKGSLYVPRAWSEDRKQAELVAAAAGFDRYRSRWLRVRIDGSVACREGSHEASS